MSPRSSPAAIPRSVPGAFPASGRALGRIAALLVLGGACSSCAEEERPLRPNVLLISIDTLRADHLSCYGYERETSPNIDALAAAGVRFEECTSTTSWTLPAHHSLLTGLSVSAHGICDERLWDVRGPDGGVALPLRGAPLSRVLREAGYRTAGFFTWKYLESRFGFGDGFDVWERIDHSLYSDPELAARFDALRQAEDWEALRRWQEEEPGLFDEQAPSAHDAVDRAVEWIDDLLAERRPEPDPFFLLVHLFDVHDDYAAPRPWRDSFDPSYDGPIDGRRVTAPDSPVHARMERRDLEHLIALYDGEIRWVDEQVGRLLSVLERRGLDRNTIVVLTSDHGEEFFEHGAKTHRKQLFRESVRVPLLLRWPGELPAGLTVAERVGIVDVAPTLYECLGVAGPSNLSGRSLLPVVHAAETGRPMRSPSLTYVQELSVFLPDGTLELELGLLRGDEHLIVRSRSDGTSEAVLLDLSVDPDERRPERIPLDGEEGRPYAQWIRDVRRELATQRAAALPVGGSTPPLDEAERSELAALGYTSANGARGPRADRSADEPLCMDGCAFGRGYWRK